MNNYLVYQLYIYPVKSLGGIAVTKAEIDNTGFKYDRRYMLVDCDNRFISQREYHPLCLLQLGFTDSGFSINHKLKNTKPLFIPYSMEKGEEIEVTIWDDKVNAIVAPPLYNQWFTEIIGRTCKLVYMSDKSKRYINTKYANNNEIVSFADAFPMLILGEESMKLLNTKLTQSISINRFRSNIVFSGGTANEEDNWKKLEINNILFKGAKPCERCIIPTINQEDGSISSEPLKTMATYRKKDNNILFGMNMLPCNSGTISIGNTIDITETI